MRLWTQPHLENVSPGFLHRSQVLSQMLEGKRGTGLAFFFNVPLKLIFFLVILHIMHVDG